MKSGLICVVLGAVLWAGAAAAETANPSDCLGVEWDDASPLAVAKIITQPRINFVKSPHDDEGKATSCPAMSEACRKKSYLLGDDLVLMGKTMGEFTCVSYQSPRAKAQIWTTGWLPRAALTAVAPMTAPAMSDWIGSWEHPGGGLVIRKTAGNSLRIEGDQVLPAGRELRNGSLGATAEPKGGIIAFVDDGSTPFERPNAGDECRVRLQRIGAWLLVQDNNDCGGAGVSFTGLYHRK